ncbi:MAG: O-antigen ligase family protein [Bacteroidia bacterium]|nr:O-antigen ligase family protein [Bacteroidia bacterium]
MISSLSVAIGLSFSHSLISIGVGGLLMSLVADRRGRATLRQTFCEWGGLYLPFLLLYGLHAVSWFYTTNKSQWLVEMRVKLPFLFLLPAAILSWKRTEEPAQKFIHLSYHLSLLTVGMGTLVRFLQNFAWGLEEIRQGRYIPMLGGLSHIYYAGLVGVGLFFLWTLPLYGGKKLRLIIAGLYGVILHTLALRTGLGALYGTGLALVGLWALRSPKRWIWAVVAIAGVGGGLVGLGLTFPPIQKRWQSLREDLATYKPGGYITYASVARRLAALEASCHAFRRSPLFGVGIADNESAIFAQIPRLPYRWDRETYILPHNQFVEYAVGLGLVGVGLFVLFWVAALWKRLDRRWEGWIIYWLLLLQVEAFLERQVGVTAFLWGTGLLWSQLTAGKS